MVAGTVEFDHFDVVAAGEIAKSSDLPRRPGSCRGEGERSAALKTSEPMMREPRLHRISGSDEVAVQDGLADAVTQVGTVPTSRVLVLEFHGPRSPLAVTEESVEVSGWTRDVPPQRRELRRAEHAGAKWHGGVERNICCRKLKPAAEDMSLKCVLRLSMAQHSGGVVF